MNSLVSNTTSLVKTASKEKAYNQYLKKRSIYKGGIQTVSLIAPFIMLGIAALTTEGYGSLLLSLFIMLGAMLYPAQKIIDIATIQNKTIDILNESPYTLLLEHEKGDYQDFTLVDLPKYQETLKNIYQNDKEFLLQNEEYTFLKKDSKNEKENYSLYQERKNFYGFSEKKQKNGIIQSHLSIKIKNSESKSKKIFQGRFEFFQNKKDKTTKFHSVEMIHKKILENTTVENFDIYLTNLLQRVYQNYQERKTKINYEKSLKQKLNSEKEEEILSDFIKKIENTTESPKKKHPDLTLLQEEINLFEKLNNPDLIQKS